MQSMLVSMFIIMPNDGIPTDFIQGMHQRVRGCYHSINLKISAKVNVVQQIHERGDILVSYF